LNLTFVKIVQIGQNQGMETLYLPSREEIHAAYVEGEEAVVDFNIGLAENWVEIMLNLLGHFGIMNAGSGGFDLGDQARLSSLARFCQMHFVSSPLCGSFDTVTDIQIMLGRDHQARWWLAIVSLRAPVGVISIPIVLLNPDPLVGQVILPIRGHRLH
jgi:hypothetical protein